MKWKILWQLERACMWIDADLHPMRERVYFWIMWSGALLLFFWSASLFTRTLILPIFTHPFSFRIEYARYFESVLVLFVARVFLLFAVFFRLPGDDRRGGPPAPPSPWPQSPEVIVLDLRIEDRVGA